MTHWTLLALVLLGNSQEAAELLVEKLAAADIDVRSRANRDLYELGAAALPALRKAGTHPDREISVRAQSLLERIEVREQLTPALRRIEGLDARLSKGGAGTWADFFVEAIPWRAGKGTLYSKLIPEDLEVLFEKALLGARNERQLTEVLGGAAHYKLQRGRAAAEALLDHGSPNIRTMAVRVLILGAGVQVLDRGDALLRRPEREIRAEVVKVWGTSGVKSAIPRLLALRGDPELTLDVGIALVQLGSKEGIPLLLKAGGWQADLYLAYHAGPEIIPQMRGRLKWMQRDPNAADHALIYLGNWGDRETRPLIEQAVQAFRLWGNNPVHASQALFLMGAGSRTQTLLKLAEEGCDAAVEVLGLAGNRGAVPGLRALLAKNKPSVVLALAELGDQESIPAIRRLLTHRDEQYRTVACTALALLNDLESSGTIAAMEEAVLARRIWPALKNMEGPDGAALPLEEPSSGNIWGSEYYPQLHAASYATQGRLRTLGLRAAATQRAGRPVESLIRWLGRQGDDAPGLVAAAALSRMGRREGLPSLLEAEQLLFSLNALRQPEAWARLEGRTTSLNLYASYEEIHRKLAGEAGLQIEGPPPGSAAHKAWTDVHQRFWKWGRPATLAEAFEMIEDGRWSLILEKDRVRIVPHDEALAFWLEWAKSLK